MRSVSNKHASIAAPARKIRHVKDRIDVVDIRPLQAPCDHGIPPTGVPPAKLSRDSFHVWLLTTLGQVSVVEREVDQLLWRGLRETAVAECPFAAVDEDDSGFVKIGLR